MEIQLFPTAIVCGLLIAFLLFCVSVVRQRKTEREWIKANGPIPDGYCLVYDLDLTTDESVFGSRPTRVCELREIMPSQKGMK